MSDEPRQEPRPEPGSEPGSEPRPEPELQPADARRGAGLRLLAAAVPLPWAFAYGVTGVWAVFRGAQGLSDGLRTMDVGYSRLVTPASVVYVGALLLAGFGVLLAGSMLLAYDRRSPMVWIPVLFVSTGLAAGAVWAAARGGLSPALWLLFFFGLVYVAVVAAVRIARVTRASRRDRIAAP